MTREEAIYQIKNLAVLSSEKDMASITEALNMAMAALEQESKRGKWVKKEHLVPLARDAEPLNWDKYEEKTHSELEEYWHCSECGYEADRHFRPSWKYCPNCGLPMRGEEE